MYHTQVTLFHTVCVLFTLSDGHSKQGVCIEDVLSIEAAAKTFLSRAEATTLEGFGWFQDSYGRQMRSLESVLDQISRDAASSTYATLCQVHVKL